MDYDKLMQAMGYKNYPYLTVTQQEQLEKQLRLFLERTVGTIVEQ